MRRTLLLVWIIVPMLLLVSCSSINDFDHIFNNDSEVLEDHSGVSFKYTAKNISDDRINIYVEMSGALTLWEISVAESDAPIEIACETTKVRGDFKLVLINSDKEIIVIADKRDRDTYRGKLPVGTNYIKLIGKSLSMDFDAVLKYHEPYEVVNLFSR